jgi:hypothetical protein
MSAFSPLALLMAVCSWVAAPPKAMPHNAIPNTTAGVQDRPTMRTTPAAMNEVMLISTRGRRAWSMTAPVIASPSSAEHPKVRRASSTGRLDLVSCRYGPI